MTSSASSFRPFGVCAAALLVVVQQACLMPASRSAFSPDFRARHGLGNDECRRNNHPTANGALSLWRAAGRGQGGVLDGSGTRGRRRVPPCSGACSAKWLERRLPACARCAAAVQQQCSGRAAAVMGAIQRACARCGGQRGEETLCRWMPAVPPPRSRLVSHCRAGGTTQPASQAAVHIATGWHRRSVSRVE